MSEEIQLKNLDAGDIVYVTAIQEERVVAYVENGQAFFYGYPDEYALINDCRLIAPATEFTRHDILHRMAVKPGHRGDYARARLLNTISLEKAWKIIKAHPGPLIWGVMDGWATLDEHRAAVAILTDAYQRVPDIDERRCRTCRHLLVGSVNYQCTASMPAACRQDKDSMIVQDPQTEGQMCEWWRRKESDSAQ